jgi:hypothetical protein
MYLPFIQVNHQKIDAGTKFALVAKGSMRIQEGSHAIKLFYENYLGQ